MTRYARAVQRGAVKLTTPFQPLSGTSMASPIVAGAAALVWGQLPALTRAQLIARLVKNGKGHLVWVRRVHAARGRAAGLVSDR